MSERGIPKLDRKGFVNVNDIIEDPDLQPRKQDNIWDEEHTEKALKNAMKQDGLHTPLIVQPVKKNSEIKYLLISGYRRFRILKDSGETMIYCVTQNDLTKSDRLAIIIREDLSSKEYSSEEKDRLWTEHWHSVHDAICGCDFSSIQKCKHQISKWAREMGVPGRTAKDHIRWPGGPRADAAQAQPASGDKPDKDIEIGEREMGKPRHGDKHRLEFILSAKEKEKILLAAKASGMRKGKYILRKLNMHECPHCGKELE